MVFLNLYSAQCAKEMIIILSKSTNCLNINELFSTNQFPISRKILLIIWGFIAFFQFIYFFAAYLLYQSFCFLIVPIKKNAFLLSENNSISVGALSKNLEEEQFLSNTGRKLVSCMYLHNQSLQNRSLHSINHCDLNHSKYTQNILFIICD